MGFFLLFPIAAFVFFVSLWGLGELADRAPPRWRWWIVGCGAVAVVICLASFLVLLS